MYTRKRGKVRLTLGRDERDLLAQLVTQVIGLVEPPDVPTSSDPLAALVGAEGPSEPPTDPALARLFPDAYRDDAEAAGDFRRFTEPDLRTRKVDAARTMLDVLQQDGDVSELDEEQARASLAALNDMRLILGTRLGLDEPPSADDPALDEEPMFHLYDYLTYLQGTLIEAITH